MKWFNIFTLLLVSLNFANAQESKVNSILQAIYRQVITPNDKYIEEARLFKPSNQQYTFKALERWLTDTSSNIRCRAVSLTSKIGKITDDSLLRRAVVFRLANCCKDVKPGVAGLSASYLTHYSRSDFEQQAKDTLLSCLNPDQPAFIQIMKLTGYLHISEARPILLSLISQHYLDEPQIWATQFTLARLGDQRSAKICALLAEQNSLNNLYVNNLLPDLIYTRSKYVYNELVTYLNSDETGCLSPNPNYSGQIPCAYRILEALCGKIDGYPLQANRYGDLVNSGYPEALIQAREWLAKNPAYTIIDTSY